MLRTVRLGGQLGATFGREFRLDVSCPAEAVQALIALRKGFKTYLLRHSAPGYEVAIDRHPVAQDDLCSILDGDITIDPVISGSGGDGELQAILGIVLVAVSMVFPPAAALAGVGWGMVIGGLTQLLMPMPDASPQEKDENKPSYSFNGSVNTTQQGEPVPVGYGQLIVGGAVISFGVDTERISRSASGGGDGLFGGVSGGPTGPWVVYA